MKLLNLFIKRLIDIFGSFIGTIMILPLIILIALSIKVTTKGPIIYKQERLGKNGKTFNMLKFRTMIVNAENLGDGIKVKSENDNRITMIGKILRSTSLDELPQLWNVFIGDMSMVGPRPPVPYHPNKYEDYSDIQRRRFEMKPGMTGLTQVTVRNSVSWDERILIDVEYINKFNILLDIKILLLTMLKLFKRESIYMKSERNETVDSK